VVAAGHGLFFGGGSHFCVLAIIRVCFGGFVIISGWSSLMVVHWCRRGGRAVIGHHWGRRWCGGSSGGGGG